MRLTLSSWQSTPISTGAALVVEQSALDKPELKMTIESDVDSDLFKQEFLDVHQSDETGDLVFVARTWDDINQKLTETRFKAMPIIQFVMTLERTTG